MPRGIPNETASSRTDILDALAPYITSGPSGLTVRIGTNSIVMKREGRSFEADRKSSIDSLIDAAVEMTGPLTEEEVREALKPYGSIQISFTSENVEMKIGKRTLLTSLDSPISHVITVAQNLMQPLEKFRPVLGAGNKEVAHGDIRL